VFKEVVRPLSFAPIARARFFAPFISFLGILAGIALLPPLVKSQAPPPPIKISPETLSLPLTPFYDTSDPLPAGKPGQLIRSVPSYDYRLSFQISARRILYHSRSYDGKDVAASGVVLIPRGTPPKDGWPIVAWAHEFTGSARQCAPSLRKNLNEGPLLSMYVGRGYAVVASDYSGLGTNFRHSAFDFRSNATDVIYSVAAARAAVPQLGSKWVVAGYSEGSLVAVAVAESETEESDPNFLGAIAISGVAEPQKYFERLAEGPSHAKLVFLAHGTKTVFPSFRIDDMLTDKALPLYHDVSESCEAGLASNLSAKEMLKPGWENNSFIRKFFARNTLGQKPVRAPLLVISGDADPTVPSFVTAKVVSRLCQAKDPVVFVKYAAFNASGIISESVGEQNSWLSSRFLDRSAPTNCP
jgi:pimeloyl-ACP methyl ester carboxylesterase